MKQQPTKTSFFDTMSKMGLEVKAVSVRFPYADREGFEAYLANNMMYVCFDANGDLVARSVLK